MPGRPLPILALTALAVAGCGGGDSGGGTGASDQIKSSVTQFIEAHDCSKATEGFRKELTGEADVKACGHDLSLRNKVKKLDIGKVTSSGAAGTAAVTTDGQKVTLKLVKRGDAWLIAGETVGSSAKADTTPSTSSTATAPAASAAAAKLRLVAALAPYRAGRRRFRTRVLEDIKARNLAAVKGDFGQYRDTVFNLDGRLRKIKFPASAQPKVIAVLEANRTEIADLDAVASVSSFNELVRLLNTRLKADDAKLTRSLRGLASAQ